MTTYSEAPSYNPPSPVWGYVRALLFTVILAAVGMIAVTVFQSGPATSAAPAPQADGGGYVATADEPATVDAQPITN